MNAGLLFAQLTLLVLAAAFVEFSVAKQCEEGDPLSLDITTAEFIKRNTPCPQDATKDVRRMAHEKSLVAKNDESRGTHKVNIYYKCPLATKIPEVYECGYPPQGSVQTELIVEVSSKDGKKVNNENFRLLCCEKGLILRKIL